MKYKPNIDWGMTILIHDESRYILESLDLLYSIKAQS